MATISYTIERIEKRKTGSFQAVTTDYSTVTFVKGDAYVVTWVLVSGSLDGEWFIAPAETDVSIQAYGSDWNSQTLNFQGTNETTNLPVKTTASAVPSNPVNLTEPTRTTIAMTGTANVDQVLENMLQYRPLLGGNPTNSVTVKMLIVVK